MSSFVTTEDKKYYRIDWQPSPTYTPISESDFYKSSGYKKTDIQNLRKSVYPTQGNDYLLLKADGKYFPVDYKLVPFVKYLWQQNIQTEGWNQPDEFNNGFVSMNHYTKKKESTLSLLQDKLKGISMKVLDRREDLLEQDSLVNKKIENLNKKGVLVIELFAHFISITMNDKVLEKIYSHLGLQKNEDKLRGGVIISTDYFKQNKIHKKKS